MKEKRILLLLGFLALLAITVWIGVASVSPQNLRLIACDVGQGDAILAVHGNSQILVDGGPGSSVMECLSEHMPVFDRKIEVVILTHPQLDHYEGLIEVFQAYDVEVFVTNRLISSNQSYRVLESVVGGSQARVFMPGVGTTIRLGLMQLDVVHPSKAFLTENSVQEEVGGGSQVLGFLSTTRDPNDFSVVAKLRLGEFDALLTGDIGPEISDLLVRRDLVGPVDYIKIPHHGSRNGLTEELLKKTNPKVAVISAGKKNSYGHPHKEVLDMLKNAGVKIYGTYEAGDVVVETDGASWRVLN